MKLVLIEIRRTTLGVVSTSYNHRTHVRTREKGWRNKRFENALRNLNEIPDNRNIFVWLSLMK